MRVFWFYLALLVVSAVVITRLADWEDRPPGVLGLAIGLSIGTAFVLGQSAERAS